MLGIVFKDVKIHDNIKLSRDLIQDYDLVTLACKLHGKESIRELVMTRRRIIINSTEIKDIAYVFHINKIESGVY